MESQDPRIEKRMMCLIDLPRCRASTAAAQRNQLSGCERGWTWIEYLSPMRESSNPVLSFSDSPLDDQVPVIPGQEAAQQARLQRDLAKVSGPEPLASWTDTASTIPFGRKWIKGNERRAAL